MKTGDKLKLNNLGLSLVELICAVAVFSILITGIASSVLISTRVYSKSTTDVAMQQSAQVLTNYLTNLVVDAKSVTYDEDTHTLVVTDTNDVISTIVYNPLTGQLTLDSPNGSGVLSDSLTRFVVNNSYDQNQSVNFTFSLEVANVSFDSAFTATSRNGVVSEEGSVLIVPGKSLVILEPNQEYEISYYVEVVGSISNTALEGVGSKIYFNEAKTSANDSYYEILSDKIKVHVGSAETKEELNIELKTAYINPETGLASDTKTIKVKVRRLNSIQATTTLEGNIAAGDKLEKYTICASFDKYGSSAYNAGHEDPTYDIGTYYNPFVVSWYDITMKDKDGNVVSDVTSYFDVKLVRITVGEEDSINTYYDFDSLDITKLDKTTKYYWDVTVKKEISDGSVVTFRVRGDHSFGLSGDGLQTNRIDTSYKNFDGTEDCVYGEVTIGISKPSLAASRFFRGNNYMGVVEDPNTELKFLPYDIDYTPDAYQGQWFYRIRKSSVSGDEWSSWIQVVEKSSPTSKLSAVESRLLFLPQYDYEFEYIFVIYYNGNIRYPNLPMLWEDENSPFYGYDYKGNNPNYQTVLQCGKDLTMPKISFNAYGTDKNNVYINTVSSYAIRDSLRLNAYLFNGAYNASSNNNPIASGSAIDYYAIDKTNPTITYNASYFDNLALSATPDVYYYEKFANFNGINGASPISGTKYNVYFGIDNYEYVELPKKCSVITDINNATYVTPKNSGRIIFEDVSVQITY